MKNRIGLLILVSLTALVGCVDTASAHRVERSQCGGDRRCLFERLIHMGYHYQSAERPSQEKARWIICYRWRNTGWSGCKGALIVAWGESDLHYYKTNGQYCSVFQMGTDERRTWGANPCLHGGNNIRGARAYNKSYGWGPWSCKPYLDYRNPCKKPPNWVLTL